MPALTLASVAGSSSTGHLDPGLIMDPTILMGVVFMRGLSAFGDMDLMTPLAPSASASQSVTSLVITALTGVLPDPVAAQSQTGPLIFVAPVIPALTASVSVTTASVVVPVALPLASASLSQTTALATATTLLGALTSAGQSSMLFVLPFGAAGVIAVSPSTSMSTTSMGITALTRMALDPVAAQSAASLLVGALGDVVGTSAASLSDAEALFAIGQVMAFDPTFSTSATSFPIPIAIFNLTSSSVAVTNLWLRAPSRVSVHTVRGAGARTVELAGMVPLGG